MTTNENLNLNEIGSTKLRLLFAISALALTICLGSKVELYRYLTATNENIETTPVALDYPYDNGVDIDRTIYQNGKVIENVDIEITDSEINSINPISLQELDHRIEPLVIKVGQTAVQLFILTSDKPDGSLNVVLTGWQGDWNNSLARNEMRYIISNQNPGSDIIFINHAAQGDSDPLPNSVSQELAKNGEFEKIGEFYSDSIQEIIGIARYKEINVIGHSYGGRIAIALAGSLDVKVDNLVISDSPGSRNLNGPIGVLKSFTNEGKHKTDYDKMNKNPYNIALQLQFDEHPVTNFVDFAKNSGLRGIVQQYIEQPSSLSRPTLEHDLLMASPNIAESIRFISPEASNLNYPDDIALILKRVSVFNDEIRVNQDVLNNHSHSYTSGHPEVFGYVMRSE